VDIPVIVTVVSECEDIASRIKAGASIINVSGGPKDETILKTIEAGANAITWTPPSSNELLGHIMDQYRETAELGTQPKVLHNLLL
jgi:DNA-binding NarL/FixJ family response regulator